MREGDVGKLLQITTDKQILLVYPGVTPVIISRFYDY